MSYKERIIIALDVPDFKEAERLVTMLSCEINFFKVGTELFVGCGPDIIKMIKKKGGKVFLDLKLHDIPNTVEKTAKIITDLGVDIFNVHASGGREMMIQTREAVKKQTKPKICIPPKILGVTILTSLTEAIIQTELGFKNRVKDQVLLLARLSREAGLDGVVCSPREISLIRRAIGEDFLILTPGIRPEWSPKDDQKRTLTPKKAFKEGADYIVIGRPITRAREPLSAAQKILEELEV